MSLSIREQITHVLEDLQAARPLKQGEVLVIGASTSEVGGTRIGKGGSSDIAASLYEGFSDFQAQTGVFLAFQCCEHLNRALVIERELALRLAEPEVAAIPVHKAGGAMAAYAYEQFKDPVLVEQIQADAGIDIGDTLIGMHLKHVAVPTRGRETAIGSAHVTMAYTRPKLIGGVRAVYERPDVTE
ncbi:TIGR01440 family protein [Shouchella shacheensis]|uniref:TIGR01440 family protein n=1 Tax=Shouchella shacheensis TaxID=1649580 RepID=UPI00073FC70A|nr:TIGR01440 family protein [Shouchella shacheensis]